MKRDFVVLLRGISNTPMQPFREKLEGIGLMDVESFGMSGNLLFNAPDGVPDPASLEEQIVELFGVDAFVRKRADLARIVAQNPFHGRDGAAIFFLARPVPAGRRRAFDQLEFESERPVIHGRTVYFVHPARQKGKRTIIDFERELAVRGTARASWVVERILDRMIG